MQSSANDYVPCRILPESLHFLITSGKHGRANKWIEKALKYNKAELNIICYPDIKKTKDTKLIAKKSNK